MNTPRARGSFSALLLAGTLVLAACGGDDDDPATTDAPESTDAPDAVATTIETTEAPATTVEEVEGFLFTSPEGDYSVVFPGEPDANEQEVPLPDGTTLPITFFLYESSDGRAYGTAGIVYPDGTQTSLDGAVDGAVSNVAGTLVSEEPITLQGRDGAEVVATVSDGQGTYLSRFYLDDLELHQVIAVITGEATFDDPVVAAFFDSFEFTEDR